jgi:hypothetical protein
MQAWLLGVVIHFAVRQLATFKKSIDWSKVKRDLEERVRALIPGKLFDDIAVSIANSALDSIQAVLGAGDRIEVVLKLLAEDKVSQAVEKVLSYLKEHLEDPKLLMSENDIKIQKLLTEVMV